MIGLIGKYRIENIVGHGAMGVVYQAVDDSINRRVAIKTIHPHLLLGDSGEELLKRFTTEARAAARCQHHNIVSIYDFGQQDGTPYIVMEFVNGQSLEQILRSKKPLSLSRINTLFLAVCAGLQYAHQQGIIHRDIKPANIMVVEQDVIKIADFGIAKIETSDTTQLGLSLGTPSYMAPEQSAGGLIDARVDIFALGIIAFELLSLCDDMPSVLCQYALTIDIDHTKKSKLNPKARFPQSLITFLEKCLNANIEKRFKNMSEVVSAYQLAVESIRANTQSITTLKPSNHLMLQSIDDYGPVDQNQVTGESCFDLHPDFLDVLSPSKASIEAGQYAETQIKPIIVEIPAAPKIELQEQICQSLTMLDIIRRLKTIHPVLNYDWADTIPNLLAQLDEDSRRRAYKNILEPKNITMTSAGKFVFSGRLTLDDAKKILITRQMSSAAEKLVRVVNSIKETRNMLMIGDSLEAGINLIDEINTEDNLAQQKEKLRLLEAFLYDFATELREHDFDVPPNERGLTVDMIKTYVIEVFIKQKLLNYWFSTLPLRELKKESNPFIHQEMFEAAKIRRLSIVKTERYFFLIGEVAKFEQDPYSVRRFLIDDTAMGGRFIYFNILAIDRTRLHEANYQAKVRKDLSKVMTIQRQLSNQIIEFIDGLEQCQLTYLLPLLTKPLEADGTNLQTIIEYRLRDYERNLSLLVLSKAAKTLKEYAQTPDDFEYLFFGLKSFLIELLGDIRDFYYQSSARWSTKSQEMEFKLVSYLRLMEKRKYSTFNEERENILEKSPELDYKKPMDELKAIVEEAHPKIKRIKSELKEAYRQIELANDRGDWQKFWDKCIGRKLPEPEKIRQKLDLAAKESYVAIVRIPKKYKKTSIYLEFEGLIGIDDTVRHYAFPKGEEGISLLPILIRLPEDTRDFDVNSVKEAIRPTIFSQFGATSTAV